MIENASIFHALLQGFFLITGCAVGALLIQMASVLLALSKGK